MNLRSIKEAKELFLVLMAACIPIIITLMSMSMPIVDHLGFRQTQTALTAYWMKSADGLLDFKTPVFGYPWTVPTEFPIYQYLVYYTAKIFGSPLDDTGRWISLFAFFLGIVPISKLVHGRVKVNSCLYVTYLTSPILLFYSRSFLIESLAFLFSVSAFAAFLKLSESVNRTNTIVFVLFAVLAGLQKITGLMSILIGCAVYSAFQFYYYGDGRLARRLVVIWSVVTLSVIIPISWVVYSDAIKSAHYITSFITAEGLHDWNYGTLSQRSSPSNLGKVFVLRLLLLGGLTGLVARLFIFKPKDIRRLDVACASLAIGLAGPVVFFNLYLVHDYYSVASIGFIAAGLYLIADPIRPRISTASLVTFASICIAGIINLAIFGYWYLPKIGSVPESHAGMLRVAKILKEQTREQDVVLTVGVDWDSTIPYYSQRFAVMIPSWHKNDTAPSLGGRYLDPFIVIRDLDNYLKGRRLGAIVICNTRATPDDSELATYIRRKYPLGWNHVNECSYSIVK